MPHDCKSFVVTYAGHAHMDMNRLWDWPETVQMVIDTLRPPARF